MAQATSIEWTDVSWNPVHGCSKVSPGCAHCYAETLSLRYRQTTRPWTPANAAENVILKPHKLREPLSNTGSWKQPCRVFVNSMSDLFHEAVPFAYINRVFETMVEADRHTFQVLTKRPERMLAYFEHAADYMAIALEDLQPWPNIWLGVSIENRRFVHRADVLRRCPAAVRFISAEPLLGPLVRSSARCPKRRVGDGEQCIRPLGHPGDCARSWGSTTADFGEWPPELALKGIDWLIVGGESGPGHRPMRLEWVRDLRNAARASGTAFFVKQLGGARPGGRLEDLPEDLRIREFPTRKEAACSS